MGNVVITHGGGLVDPSKDVLLRLASNLYSGDTYGKVFLARFSFEGLYTPEYWLEYNEQLKHELKNKRGTWFGTCRDIDYISNPDLFNKAISCMKERGVKTLIVAGGDGSSRQVAETEEMFNKNGINVIFAVPLTIDGINGGECIGMQQALRETYRQTENFTATAFETKNSGKFPIVLIETQGRNRDDIMANTIKYFHDKGSVADESLDDICMLAVPATLETDFETLISRINSTEKRTLVFISEGAKIKMSQIMDSCKNRKVRTLVIGHQSQSNNMTTDSDRKLYDRWLGEACWLIKFNKNKSYSIVKDEFGVWIKPLEYYAKLNPRNNQKAELSEELTNLMKTYMA